MGHRVYIFIVGSGDSLYKVLKAGPDTSRHSKMVAVSIPGLIAYKGMINVLSAYLF